MYFVGVFLFSVNAYVYIPMMLFLWLKIAINFQKWVYRGNVFFFLLEILRSCPRAILEIFMIVNF